MAPAGIGRRASFSVMFGLGRRPALTLRGRSGAYCPGSTDPVASISMSFQLPTLLSALEIIAPLRLAEDWDNVGLLLEPDPEAEISRVLLTIDLTDTVVDEAIEFGAELIVSYHPPIFGGLKRLTQARPDERALLRLVNDGIAVYSPHTALDAAAGGVNDWLAKGIGKGETQPVAPHSTDAALGAGRQISLATPTRLDSIIKRVKRHLKLDHVRVATAPEHAANIPIQSAMVCAGAGGSLLSGKRTDLLLTGEMRHHDVLWATRTGTSVILTDHTNCERGYLPTLSRAMRASLGTKLKVRIALSDADPLVIC